MPLQDGDAIYVDISSLILAHVVAQRDAALSKCVEFYGGSEKRKGRDRLENSAATNTQQSQAKGDP